MFLTDEDIPAICVQCACEPMSGLFWFRLRLAQALIVSRVQHDGIAFGILDRIAEFANMDHLSILVEGHAALWDDGAEPEKSSIDNSYHSGAVALQTD
jgi:hypothetical protein